MRPASPALRVLALVLLAGLGAIVATAPPFRADLWPWLVRMCAGWWYYEEPLVVAIFCMMGLWPLAFVRLLGERVRRGPVPAWPFLLGSFFIGAFALLPWVALSGDGDPGPAAPKPDRAWGGLLALAGATALVLGAAWGDPIGALAIVRAEGFVRIMATDFASLWLLSVLLARRRGGPWAWTLLPVAGTGLWLATRPAAPAPPAPPEAP